MPADSEPVDDGVTVTGARPAAGASPTGARPAAGAGGTEQELRRQLARRTAEVASLRAELAALTAQLSGGTETMPQVAEWRAKAAEYDALMATKTMHAVRIPRAIYGRILARRARG
jgi:hypothetical protein